MSTDPMLTAYLRSGGNAGRGYRGAYDAETCEGAVCVRCRKPAVKASTRRPSGTGWQVVCPDGHVTNGMPS